MDKNLKTLEKFLDLIDTQSSIEEIVTTFKLFIDIAEKMKLGNEQERDDIRSMFKMYETKMESMHEGMTSDCRKLLSNLAIKIDDKLGKALDDQKQSLNFIRDKVRKIKEGKDGHTPTKTELTDLIRPLIKIPEPEKLSGNDILTRVQDLEEGERWEIKDVNGLERELEKLRKMKAQGNFGGGNGLAIKNAVLVYDLSASLNGVTKTFSLPAFWRVLTVDLSSYPHSLQPTTDFTTDASNMTITFTSTIEASTSLASGQVAIITYVSA